MSLSNTLLQWLRGLKRHQAFLKQPSTSQPATLDILLHQDLPSIVSHSTTVPIPIPYPSPIPRGALTSTNPNPTCYFPSFCSSLQPLSPSAHVPHHATYVPSFYGRSRSIQGPQESTFPAHSVPLPRGLSVLSPLLLPAEGPRERTIVHTTSQVP